MSSHSFSSFSCFDVLIKKFLHHLFEVCRLRLLIFKKNSNILFKQLNSLVDRFVYRLILFDHFLLNFTDLIRKIGSIIGDCYVFSTSDDVFYTLELFLQVEKPNMIIYQANVFIERTFFLLGTDVAICIAHDSNDHIHENNHKQESTKDKHEPKQVIILTIDETAEMEIS